MQRPEFDLHASPLWDADGNLLFRLFEHGKASIPVAILYDYQFEELVERLQGDLEVAQELDKQRKGIFDPLEDFSNILADSNPDAITFIMPTLDGDRGRNHGSPTLAYMRVKIGDQFQPKDVLFEVETDKACLAIEAKEAGTITQILVKPGTEIAPGDEILRYKKCQS
jgi:hypothetical protein